MEDVCEKIRLFNGITEFHLCKNIHLYLYIKESERIYTKLLILFEERRGGYPFLCFHLQVIEV